MDSVPNMSVSVSIQQKSELSLKSAEIPKSVFNKFNQIELGSPVILSARNDRMVVSVTNYSADDVVRVDNYTSAKLGAKNAVKGTLELVEPSVAQSIGLAINSDDVQIDNMKSVVRGVGSRLNGLYLMKGEQVSMKVNDSVINLQIEEISPQEEAVKITDNTDIRIVSESKEEDAGKLTLEPEYSYKDIKGMDDVKQSLREYVMTSLNSPDAFYGISPPRGTILYGPSGTGKSMIAQATAEASDSTLFFVSSSQILTRNEKLSIEKMFRTAVAEEPAVVVIDDIDKIATSENPSRRQAEAMSRIKSAFSVICSDDKVSVIATARGIEEIDESLLAPSRFGETIEVGIPDRNDRRDIIELFVNRMEPDISESEIDLLSKRTVGYTGADIKSLCREATFAMHRRVSNGNIQELENEINGHRCNFSDFEEGIENTNPTLLEKYDVSVPDFDWSDIGGYRDTIGSIKSTIEGPLEAPELWAEGERSKGILLHGPPGTGKTTIARAMANESNRTFIGVHSTALKNKFVGETERNIRELFSLASKLSPSIIYIDEIDSISRQRGEVSGSPTIDAATSEFLGQLDGIEDRGDVIVVGSTNADYDPSKPLQYQEDVEFGLDRAMLRPGRLGTHFYIGRPDKQERKDILRIHLEKVSQHDKVKISEDVDLDKIASNTEGAVGADIEAICLSSKQISRQSLLDEHGNYSDIPKNKKIIIERKHLRDAIERHKTEQ